MLSHSKCLNVFVWLKSISAGNPNSQTRLVSVWKWLLKELSCCRMSQIIGKAGQVQIAMATGKPAELQVWVFWWGSMTFIFESRSGWKDRWFHAPASYSELNTQPSPRRPKPSKRSEHWCLNNENNLVSCSEVFFLSSRIFFEKQEWFKFKNFFFIHSRNTG